MPSLKQPPVYISHLLRCWLEGSTRRYSLEEIGVGKKHVFATLDEFVSFLIARSELPDAGENIPGAEDYLDELLIF